MIHSTLGIHSLLKKQSLKHNVIDRDRILIPPNWDSWGKIHVLREGFDVEGISKGWSVDIQQPALAVSHSETEETEGERTPRNGDMKGVIPIYENTIKDPRREFLSNLKSRKSGLDVDVVKNQDFLAGQLEIMERLKAEEERIQEKNNHQSPTNTTADWAFGPKAIKPTSHDSRPVTEHIGPVQFNMGGIQVDSDQMIFNNKSLGGESQNPSQKPNQKEAPTPGMPAAAAAAAVAPGTPPEGEFEAEALNSFFASLISKRVGANSPKPTSS